MTVNTVTGEIVEALSQRDAERLTTRIRLRLDTIADNYAAVMPLIREAYEGQAWAALGYRSHGDYVHQSFGDALSNLGVDMRRAVVGELTEQGMSTRAIATVIGVSKNTVHRDSGVPRGTPLTNSTEASPADEVDPHAAPAEPQGGPTLGNDATAAAPEREGHRAPASPSVVGIDGKTYSRPEARPVSSDVINAETNSKALASAVLTALPFEHEHMRATAVRHWGIGKPAVSPSQRNYVTANHLRTAARGLLALAEIWEDS